MPRYFFNAHETLLKLVLEKNGWSTVSITPKQSYHTNCKTVNIVNLIKLKMIYLVNILIVFFYIGSTNNIDPVTL